MNYLVLLQLYLLGYVMLVWYRSCWMVDCRG